MSHPLAWICLIAALAGPSLAHAEAADDLARSLVDGGDLGQLRPVDGGVGDEPVEASRGPAAPRSSPGVPSLPHPPEPATARAPGPLREAPASAPPGRRDDPRAHPGATRRHVWLQVFRD